MAINLNTKAYGEQFNAFVNFASKQTNLSNVARVGETKAGTNLIGLDGEPRTITAKNWDGSGQVWRLGGSRKVNNEVRDLFLKTILSVCSADKIEELPQSVQDVLKAQDFDGKGRPLTARRIKAVTDAVLVASNLTAVEGNIAFGTSPAVKKIQNMVMTAPCVPPDAEPDKKLAAFSAKLSEKVSKEIVGHVPHMICKQFIADGKMDVNKEHEQFIKDQNRDMKVFIEGLKHKNDVNKMDGDKTYEVPKNFETARDKIVQFITGDKEDVDTFESASDSVKRQTCLLMSLITQYTSSAVLNSFLNLIEKDGVRLATMEDSGLCKGGTGMTFTLSRTSKGDIQISFEQDVGIRGVNITGDTLPYFLDYDRSCCHIGAEINLSAQRLETVANGDWTDWDFEAFEAEGQKCNFDKQMDILPANLRLDTKVSASVTFEIYTAKPLQDPTSEACLKMEMEKRKMEQNAGGDNNIIKP